MTPKIIPAAVARRFVLGQQGLWPGRRWRGLAGVTAAVREVGEIQVDPLDVVGRSHDLAFTSRVDGYRPSLLGSALYDTRELFEWGGNLQIRPIEELPFLRSRMREAANQPRWILFSRKDKRVIDRVLKEVETRGPVGSRDLVGGRDVESYRASKDTGLALYYLWLRGDIMIHSRSRGERKYDLTSRLVPAVRLRRVSEEEAREHLFLRRMRSFGLANASEMGYALRYATGASLNANARKEWGLRLERSGDLERVNVEGWKGSHWVLRDDRKILDALSRGETPQDWDPISTTSEEEVTFLAPLEIVSARGRSSRLFDFDYVWEVYKPAGNRKWGYYTLPILHGDQLRARTDLRFDKSAGALRVLGFWLEDSATSKDIKFARALSRGFERLRYMTGAISLDPKGLPRGVLRSAILAS